MEWRLQPRLAGGGRVERTQAGWRLDLPAGQAEAYRLAQVDDYGGLARRRFPHRPPFTLRLQARLSAQDLPGTWGFGLWNDPFGLSLGFGGSPLRLPALSRLPALPQAAWFFHASAPNWLALREGVPGEGFFAGTFRSAIVPTPLLIPALLALPLMGVRPLARWARRLAGRVVRQEGVRIGVDVTEWHEYTLGWEAGLCHFGVDGEEVLATPLTPRPPLGLVMWVDNQYAAWRPDGSLGYGTLANEAAWMEVAADAAP